MYIDITEYSLSSPPLFTISGTGIIDQSLGEIIEDAARLVEGIYYEDFRL